MTSVTVTDNVTTVSVSDEQTVVATVDVGAAGPAGRDGAPGGSMVSGWWSYDTSTVMADPGSGKIRSSGSGVVDDPVSFALSDIDDDGISWDNVGVAQVGDHLVLRDVNGDRWDVVIGTITDNTGWAQIDGTLIHSTGAAPRKNTSVQVSLVKPSPKMVFSTTRPLTPEPGTIWVPTT